MCHYLLTSIILVLKQYVAPSLKVMCLLPLATFEGSSLYIYMHFWHFSSDVEIHGYLCQRTEWWIWSDSWTCGWISLNSFENFFAVMCSSSALASFLPPVFPGVLLYVWMINSLYSFYPYYFHPYFTLWVCLNIFFCCMF